MYLFTALFQQVVTYTGYSSHYTVNNILSVLNVW